MPNFTSGVIRLDVLWMGVGVGVMRWASKQDLAGKMVQITSKDASQMSTGVIIQEIIPHLVAELRIHYFPVEKLSDIGLDDLEEPEEGVHAVCMKMHTKEEGAKGGREGR